MRSSGVILFHDINVRSPRYEVWRLWEELAARFPHFEFFHGNGLGVLAAGADYPPALESLFTASSEEKNSIRQFFHRLGTGLEATYALQRHQNENVSTGLKTEEAKSRMTTGMTQEQSAFIGEFDRYKREIAYLMDRLEAADRVTRRYNALCRWLPARILDAWLTFGVKGLLNRNMRTWSGDEKKK